MEPSKKGTSCFVLCGEVISIFQKGRKTIILPQNCSYSGTSEERTRLGPAVLSFVEKLSAYFKKEEKQLFFCKTAATVEPLKKGHVWDQLFCPLWRSCQHISKRNKSNDFSTKLLQWNLRRKDTFGTSCFVLCQQGRNNNFSTKLLQLNLRRKDTFGTCCFVLHGEKLSFIGSQTKKSFKHISCIYNS